MSSLTTFFNNILLLFQSLEVWQEIRDELEKEEIEAVSTDKECMSTIINFLQSKAENVADIQVSKFNNNSIWIKGE